MIRVSSPNPAASNPANEPSPGNLAATLADHRVWLDSGGARGQRANLSGVDLSHQDLAGVVLTKARMVETNLTGADLSDATLDQASLYGANLTDAELPRATLIDANLCEVQLDGADLTGADLSRADLTDACFGSACLQDANLSRAELEGADLRRAELSGCDLTGADIAGAQCAASSMDDAFEAYDVDDTPVDEEPISEMPDADLDEGTESPLVNPTLAQTAARTATPPPKPSAVAAFSTLAASALVESTLVESTLVESTLVESALAAVVSRPAPTATPKPSPAPAAATGKSTPAITVSSAAIDSALPAPAVTLTPAPAPAASPAAITAPLQIASDPALARPRVDLLAEQMAQELAREFAQNLIAESTSDELETAPVPATSVRTKIPQPPSITVGPAPAPLVSAAGATTETSELAEALQQHHRWQRSRGREGQRLDLSWTSQQAFIPEQRQQLAGADLSGALAPRAWPGMSALAEALCQFDRQLMWLLGGCVYLMLSLASMVVADWQQSVQLPLLAVPISAHWFGLLAPLALMLLHGALHLSLAHLGRVARSLPQVLPDGSRPEQYRASLGLMALPQDHTTAKRWSSRLGRGLSTMLLWLMAPAILVLMCSLWWATMGIELLTWAGVCTVTTLVIGIASRRALRTHGQTRPASIRAQARPASIRAAD